MVYFFKVTINLSFHKLVSFIASVHRVRHELTKDAKADSITHALDILQTKLFY